jgi:hypothetical protein
LAAHVRGTQRLDEPARFGLQRLLGERQRAQLLSQRGVRADAILLHLLQLRVDLRQRLFEGLHELLDRAVASIQIELCALLEFRQRGSGKIQKRLVVPPQRF